LEKWLKITYTKVFCIFSFTVIVLLLAGLVYSAEFSEKNPSDTKPKFSAYKVSGSPVILVDDPTARDPTWEELMHFLEEDDTDRILYQLDSFNCIDFAERLHNNAENRGIRAAYVSVSFQDRQNGHAINAFETVDKGLVFIDCTGAENPLGELDSNDKVAYIVPDREYGSVSIYYTDTPDYEFYEMRKGKRLKGFFKSIGTVKDTRIFWGM
jgi:hypothetical protein